MIGIDFFFNYAGAAFQKQIKILIKKVCFYLSFIDDHYTAIIWSNIYKMFMNIYFAAWILDNLFYTNSQQYGFRLLPA